MQKTHLYLAGIVICILCLNFNCKKEVLGCTNSSAENFNPNANTDNNTCCIPRLTNNQATITMLLQTQTERIPFADLKLTQSLKEYTSTACGKSGEYSVKLKIVNRTPFATSFNYTILFRLNAISWQYQNTVTLQPLATVDVGEINQSPGKIDLPNTLAYVYTNLVFEN